MPQSPSPRLGLYRTAADGSEDVNVVLDVLNNLDKLDTFVGALACTSGTHPASPYNGQVIRETDTGKLLVCTNTSGPVFTQVLFGTAVYGSALNVVGSVSLTGPSGFFHESDTSFDISLATSVDGDTQHRFRLFASGRMEWGPGGATARDVSLYRSSADVLTTDDSFTIGGGLTVTGDATIGGNIVADQLATGSAVLRGGLSTVTTVASTASEAVLALLNIPAADAVAGAVYRIRAWGTAAVTGTPTMTFRLRLGGVAGTSMGAFGAITCRSAMSDGSWDVEALITCASTGASGTWNPVFKAGHNFVTNNTNFLQLGPVAAASTVKDTTVSNDFVITGQWSASSPSNSIVCRGISAQRVA